ncbi:MAG: ImmA/IrrE family metallo-endopeptidase [Thermoleophilia bacterium]
MSARATAINPELLIWARERAGLSLDEVASLMNKRPETIAAWEAGSEWPTYLQLESLAESVFRRPVALFFLHEPPEEAPAQKEFRTLPDFDIRLLSADSRFAIRLSRAYQESLYELTGGSNPAERHILKDLNIEDLTNIAKTAGKLRKYLGVSVAQQKSWRTTSDAMTIWRRKIEDAGVYVFKRSFKQHEISGFCLSDDEFPIVMINNSTPFTRQIFTLFHELAHLLKGLNSITTADGSFIDRMKGPTKSIEVDCNRIAAEFLVPSDSFPWGDIDVDDIQHSVSNLAEEYNVSREVILRRLLDQGWLDSATYKGFVRAWVFEDDPARGGDGGSYYYNQAAYLGDSFLRLAFSRYRAGVISISELSEHLGIKAKFIPKFEDVIGGKL